MTLQEIACCIGAVDLEALLSAAVLRGEPHVVKHRARVQQLRIEAQTAPLACQRAEQIHSGGVVEQQRRLGIPHHFNFPRHSAIRNAEIKWMCHMQCLCRS
jgi:hypothetical protein